MARRARRSRQRWEASEGKESLPLARGSSLRVSDTSSGSNCTGVGFGFFLLYNRGIPATSSTSIDEMQVNREVAKKPVFIAAGLTVLFGAIGGTLSQLLPLSFLLEEATVAVGVVLGFFTSATFFKVQDEDGAWY